MSRVGKVPVTLPKDVKVQISGDKVQVEGKLGKLELGFGHGVHVTTADGKVVVSVKEEMKNDPQTKASYGTIRARLNSMVLGVSQGWKRSLEMNGVGFNARLQGQTLVLACGYSHDVKLDLPQGVKCTINKNVIDLEGPDKEVLGTFAARVRKTQPPEPYLGKGIKFVEEVIRRKAGKTAKK